MMFTEAQLNSLRDDVGRVLSQHRYTHTLGVADAAARIAGYFDDIDKSEVIAAAYLHDISKEYSEAEQQKIISSHSVRVCESDILSPAVMHSLTAPFVILRDFPAFATDNVLSAVYNHTLGAPDMSLFDEIIFIADYIEDGRRYPACISVRERLYADLASLKDRRGAQASLHTAVVSAANATIASVSERGGHLHERTLATRDAFLKLLDNMKG